MIKVCFVQCYRSTNYVRGESLRAGLSLLDNVELTVIKNETSGIRRYLEVLMKLRRVLKSNDFDLVIIGFRGHEIFWPVRWLVGSTPIVFDEMMSPSLALVEEKRNGVLGSIIGRFLYFFERAILSRCEVVLTDTESHAQAIGKWFGLDRNRLYVIPVGAESGSISCPQKLDHREVLTVLYYGSFLPLHGLDVILEAVSKLQIKALHFEFIGGDSKVCRKIKSAFEKNARVSFRHRKWVPYEELLSIEIPRCDLLLGGPFGGTAQGRRVVTGKTIQGLASGVPVVIGEVNESFGFESGENCLLVRQNDPESFSEALNWASEHCDELSDIGLEGRKLFEKQFSSKKISQNWDWLLRHLVALKELE